MEPTRRFRVTLRQLMVVTALLALVCAGVAWYQEELEAKRQRAAQVLVLRAQQASAAERAAWAERMFAKGYVSKAELEASRKEWHDLRSKSRPR